MKKKVEEKIEDYQKSKEQIISDYLKMKENYTKL